jgi:hypothetical protein
VTDQSRATVRQGRSSGQLGLYEGFGFESWEEDPGARPGAVPGRRTVTITGHGLEGWQSRNGTRPSTAQRHTQLKRHEREGFRPDRVAMWAVLLGIVLLLVAATSSHAAVLAVHHALALH